MNTIRHGEAIRVGRAIRHMTQARLGRAVGVSPVKICLIEQGKVAPKPDELRRIWNALSSGDDRSDVGSPPSNGDPA
jgi:predicted transcriptional regulator